MANKENIKLWVDALRSNEYEQGTGSLCKYNKHCCLGVACEVYQKVVGDLSITKACGYISAIEYDYESNFLPTKVINWLGLSSKSPISTIPYYDEDTVFKHTYMELNDKLHYSFKQIADVIEKQFLGE